MNLVKALLMQIAAPAHSQAVAWQIHRKRGWGRKTCRAGRLHAGGHDGWISVSGEGRFLQGLNKFSHTLVALPGVHGQSSEQNTLYLRRHSRIEDAGRYQFVLQAAIDR